MEGSGSGKEDLPAVVKIVLGTDCWTNCGCGDICVRDLQTTQE